MSDTTTAVSSITQCFDHMHLDYAEYLFAGSVAGGCRALSRGLTFPFDTMKTLIQADSSKKGGDITEKPNVDYYRGVVPTVTAAIPANALFFLVFNTLETIELTFTSCYNNGFQDEERFIARLLISTLATLPQNLIKIPSELIKQRAQTQPGLSYQELFSQAYDRDGVSGFYRGWEAQLLREIPYNAVQMTTFAYLRDLFSHSFMTNSLENIGIKYDGAFMSAFEGLLAASLAAVVTQPADVMKTKMMTEGVARSSASNGLEASSIAETRGKTTFLGAAKKIYSEEGLRGFFQGLKPRLYIVGFGGMIYFWASSWAENLFRNL